MKGKEMGREISPWDRFAWIVGIGVVAPIMVLFDIFGDEGQGRVVALVVGVFLVAMKATWSMHRSFLYWIVIVILGIAHAILIVEFQWSSRKLSYLALLPFVALDFFLVYGVIWVVLKIRGIGDA